MDAWQVAVKDHDVVGVGIELGGRVQPVVSGVDGHALIAQALDEQLRERPRALDSEHPRARAPAGTSSTAGSRMLTPRPPSRRACRSSDPPWASAMAATIDSPRPEPSSEPVRSAPI